MGIFKKNRLKLSTVNYQLNMDVQLFIPCYIDQLYPETGFNTIKVLEKAGCTVHYNPNQTCCGQPAFNSGYWEEAGSLAEKFLKDFNPDMPVVSPSGSCSSFIIHHYHKVLADRFDLLERHQQMKNNIYELSDFLVNVLKIENLGAKFPHTVTFHDSCSALREYGIKDEPRRLLANVESLKLIEMEESDTCCGFGGTFAVKNNAISSAMAEKKVINALATNAEYIVSTEASCLMNINGYCKKQNLPLKGIHLADILASGL
jgi:L-lactate dehydrogenase complex protein LldE